MIDFIDKTSEQPGTPINRKNLMAMQGFIATTTTFEEDGSIIETNSEGHILRTSFNADGSIYEVFVGEKSIRKMIRFEENGSIVEELL